MKKAIDFTVIIPARYTSTRLPGKPLLEIGDKTLIQHVCERAASSKAKQVVVATDDQRIFAHVQQLGYTPVMTPQSCQSGTDRIARAIETLGIDDQMVIVNLQGDEPFMPASVIEQVASGLTKQTDLSISTACEIIHNEKDFHSPDVVKLVRDRNDLALYFSRCAIPFYRDLKAKNIQYKQYKHLGIYAYTAVYIKEFSKRGVCALENSEQLEQLRALWYGDKIYVCEVDESTGIGVDTPADLLKAREIYAKIQP